MVSGGEGADVYFATAESAKAHIDNYASDGKMDYLIIQVNYLFLHAKRDGLHLYIKTWFKNDSYQHMIFKTEKGVLFNHLHLEQKITWS